jgi:hypothetical protein
VLESEKRQKEKELAVYSQLLLNLGAPDCPVVHRTVSGAPGWLWRKGRSREFVGGVRLKFTGLSDEPTVGRANGRPCNPRVTRGRANGQMGAPDCPVCTRQCPVRQRLQIFNGRLCQNRKAISTKQCSCTTRQKARIAFLDCFQRLLATLGL